VLSDSAGRYSIVISDASAVLVVSFTGFQTQELKTAGSTALDVVLMPAQVLLNEIVVTALGIQRERRELGYGVQTVKGDALTSVRQTNLVNALAGRVAGVQVTNGSSGVGSSSRIVIRGENSLTGSNQPLFVVDGVPISNNTITNNTENNETGFQEVDYGNGAADISPDDIESVTVLKGAGATALYGRRAAGGVILIKTRDGGNSKGVRFNSSVTWESPLVLPKYQNVYGAGAGGKFSYEDGFGGGINDGGLNSFGPKMEGQPIPQFNGPSQDGAGKPVRGGDILARGGRPIMPTPFTAQPDNVRDYFQTGITTINNIAFSGGKNGTAIRLSYTNLDNKGIMPNTGLRRNSLSFSGAGQMSERVSARAFFNYIRSSSTNRPALGYGSENPMYTFNWSGRQVATKDLQDYWQVGKRDFNQFNANYLWLDNPYFTAYENTNGFVKDRLLGNASVKWDLNSRLSLRMRAGIDSYHDLRESKRAFSTKRFVNGAYREDEVNYNELNTDALLVYTTSLAPQTSLTVSAGGNVLLQASRYKSTTANQLSVPAIYNFGNAKVPLVANEEYSKKQINSLYALANIGYKDFLFGDLTIRRDASSTLPQEKNGYTYYAASGTLLLSEIMSLPRQMNFAKVRASYALVGNDTEPYQLNNTYVFNQNYGTAPLLTSSTRLLNPSLSPESLQALEGGAEFYFFSNRAGLELTAYQNTSSGQIINLPASAASGYTSRLINGGTIQSRGVEVVVRAVPALGANFKWSSFLNFSSNRSRVASLPQGVEQYVSGFESLYASTDNTIFFIAAPGGRIGDMWGTGLQQVNGQTVYDAKGFPVRDPKLKNLGNYNPDFILGFGNDLSYKNLSLNFLWDWRQGGVFFSRTLSLGSTSGILASTLPGREGGVVGQGVTNAGTATDPKYVANTTAIAASDYYGQYYNRANEASSMFDASYLKLRQVAFSYAAGPQLCRALRVETMKLGILLNNVLLFTQNPNVDPEVNAVQGRKYVYGVDDMSLPSSRSIGFNLNVAF
jgi:TonB-linked SusC/RagA family outer membrane protein